LSGTLHSSLLDWKEAFANFAQDPAHLLANVSFLSLSAIPGIGFLVWNPVTGKPLKKFFKTLYEGPISVIDLILHADSLILAIPLSVISGSDWRDSYTANTHRIRQLTGRDIGDWRKDAVLGGATIIIAVTFYFTPGVIAMAEAGTLTTTAVATAQTTTWYVMQESNTALGETNQECMFNAMNCSTATDIGITFGFNLLPGLMPDFGLDQATIGTKDALLKQSDEIVEVGEDVGMVGKVLNNSDDLVKTVVKSNLADQEIDNIAKGIVNGHAFEKHVVNPRRIEEVIESVKTKDEFEKLLKKIMKNPDDTVFRNDGAIAFWNNEKEVIVIYNPNGIDKSTAFKPEQGKLYFDNFLRNQ